MSRANATTSTASRRQLSEVLAEIRSKEDSLSKASNTVRELKRSIAELRRALPLDAINAWLCSSESQELERPDGRELSPGPASESDLSRYCQCERDRWTLSSVYCSRCKMLIRN